MLALPSNWKLYAGAVAALVVALLTVWGCWHLWSPAPKKPEVYAPPAVQRDGSVMLEKKPDAKAVPKQVIPKGAKVERLASVTVQPRAVVATTPAAPGFRNHSTSVWRGGHIGGHTDALIPNASCPPVTVDLSLIRLPDQTRRVVASSPDGEVVGGLDVPVEDAAPAPAARPWAAGIAVDPFRRTGGIFIDRDLAFLRLGAQVNQRELGGWPGEVWLKAGIRW